MLSGELNYQAMTFWWNVFLTLCLVGLAVFQWLQGRHQANAKDIKLLRDELHSFFESSQKERVALDRRLTTLERDVRHMPSHDDIKQLISQFNSLNAEMSRAVGNLQGLTRWADIVHQHLLSKDSGLKSGG